MFGLKTLAIGVPVAMLAFNVHGNWKYSRGVKHEGERLKIHYELTLDNQRLEDANKALATELRLAKEAQDALDKLREKKDGEKAAADNRVYAALRNQRETQGKFNDLQNELKDAQAGRSADARARGNLPLDPAVMRQLERLTGAANDQRADNPRDGDGGGQQPDRSGPAPADSGTATNA